MTDIVRVTVVHKSRKKFRSRYKGLRWTSGDRLTDSYVVRIFTFSFGSQIRRRKGVNHNYYTGKRVNGSKFGRLVV